MIGQNKIKDMLDRFTIETLPRFLLIVGEEGSGKKELCKYISSKFKIELIPCNGKMDEIRYLLNSAYIQRQPTMYLLSDLDNMSNVAKNSLLKFTEEPPNEAYICITLSYPKNSLDTLNSRCFRIDLEPYTTTELKLFIENLGLDPETEDNKFILDTCSNFNDIKEMLTYNIKEFKNYTEKVYNNICLVDGCNCFKPLQQLKLKESDTGYCPRLFLRALSRYYFIDITRNNLAVKPLQIIYKYLQKLTVKSFNKTFKMDMLVLELRSVYNDFIRTRQ